MPATWLKNTRLLYACSVSIALDSSSPELAEFSVKRSWQSDRRSPARWLYSYISRNPGHMLGILLGSLGNSLGGAVMPIFIGQAVDAVRATPAEWNGVVFATLMVIASQILRTFVQYWRNFSSEIISQRIERDVRDELYASLIGKSMAFHDRQRVGDIMARVTNDVRQLNFLMTPGVNIVVGSGAFLLFPLFLAPRYSWQLIAAPLFYVICYVFAVVFFLKRLGPANDAERAKFGAMNAVLAESIEGVETVKGAAQEARERSRFAGMVESWRGASVRLGDVEALYLPGLVFGLTLAFAALHSLLMYSNGEIKLGDVVGYVGLIIFLRFPTFATQFAYPQVSAGFASARRILQLMNAETTLDQNEAGHAAEMRGEVAFEDVIFGYHDGADARNALDGASFAIKAGQTVAIVGQTGSGKSTLTKLINRTYDVDGGAVKVDGVDVRTWNLAALRKQISYIEQDIFLYSRTIAENISFGVPGATQEQIERAARAAQAHVFITGFKDGYQTVVGERGVTLSGGQRQRIAIARAFLTNPKILVLDDSTSAIDSATEDEIQRAMFEVAQGRTTFVITHRLSQIRWADVIVVLRKGRVDAVGSHESLLETSAAYRNIFG
jgi:ATP-binding cassette, subfamily B, bacterial